MIPGERGSGPGTAAVRCGLKICGVIRTEDLQTCAALGVDAVGFNFWPSSRRFVAPAAAAEMIAAIEDEQGPGAGPTRVGVFVDADARAVTQAVQQAGLALIQPHGDAPVEPYARLAADLGVGWIWVIRGTPSLAGLAVPTPAPRWVLLDAAVPGFGGAGQRTDWGWAAAAVRALAPLPVWLAGGLDPGNVAAALEQVAPAGIDVASGAEAPGVGRGRGRGEKSAQAIAALLAACHHGRRR